MTIEEVEALLKLRDRVVAHNLCGWMVLDNRYYDPPIPNKLWGTRIELGEYSTGVKTRGDAMDKLCEMLEKGEVTL